MDRVVGEKSKKATTCMTEGDLTYMIEEAVIDAINELDSTDSRTSAV
jgi:hypothetical protein